jgi:hypothetical protein
LPFKQNNINARAIFPDSLPDKEKTDWNDVHRIKGLAEVQKQLIKNDLGASPSNPEKPLAFSGKIKNWLQIKSLKLDEHQITNIQNNLTKKIQSYPFLALTKPKNKKTSKSTNPNPFQ